MSPEDTSDDAEIEELVEQLTKSSDSGYPKSPTKESVFKFFKTILDLKDSRKVANLTKEEIGYTRLPTRGYLEIAAYAAVEGLDKVEKYLLIKAEIAASTSMGKKGFLAQLFVTQIKQEKKTIPHQPTKKKWLSKSKEETGEEA